MQGCSLPTENGLALLRRLKELHVLDLSYVRAVSDALLDRLHGKALTELHLAEGHSGPAAFSTAGVTRLVLGCPALTLLDLSCVESVGAELVDQLARQLPHSRDVTLYVGGTDLQELPPPPPPGHLRLVDTNTVPLHMRGIIDDMLWSDDDSYSAQDPDDWDIGDMYDSSCEEYYDYEDPFYDDHDLY
ncbi:uncharacterized protein LOC119099252 [Pollicipes pollicipes]|nr:uncharacterized protein LOC119099252 [Pollicipes pollicipes]